MINEIHYDEDDKTVSAEFIEIYNPSDQPVDLSGYYFSSGIDYTFPGGAILGDGEYLVVAEDPATGSANCALAGLRAQLDPQTDGELHWKIAQGVEMGRPSTLYLKASTESIEVGGRVVLVGSGELI